MDNQNNKPTSELPFIKNLSLIRHPFMDATILSGELKGEEIQFLISGIELMEAVKSQIGRV